MRKALRRVTSPPDAENMQKKKLRFGWLLPAFVAIAAAWPSASSAQSGALDSEAVNLLRQSTAYVAGLKQFRVDTEAALEIVTTDGEKLQYDEHVVITVQRPNKLRADRMGEIVNQVAYYDGKSLSMNLPDDGYYATAAAPPTLESALDFARDQLGIVAPAADLVYTNSFERLSDGLTSAKVIGEAVVAGVACDHLAFRNPEVDWQIWIEQGDKPLPRKLVITSKKMPQSPEFIVVIKKWDTSPRLKDAMFSFTPTKGSQQIEFLPTPAAAKK